MWNSVPYRIWLAESVRFRQLSFDFFTAVVAVGLWDARLFFAFQARFASGKSIAF